MNSLLRFNENQLYLFYDFETCNTNLALDNWPWQVGFIVTNHKEVLEKHNYYIHWDNIKEKISEGARERTKFNYDVYIKNAQPQEKVLDIFESYLYDDKYLRIGHNIFNFDIFVHNFWRRVNNRKTNYSYLNNALDTDAIARAWKSGVKQIKKGSWMQDMFKYGDIKVKGMKTRLEYLGPEFGIPFDYNNLHDAVNDVTLNFLVWQQLKYKIDI